MMWPQRCHRASARASGKLLIFRIVAEGGCAVATLTMGELVAVLALGQDSSFGQPLETQARSTLLAIWLAEAAGLAAQDRDTAYWAAQLRYLGCTAHAHEVA